MTPPVLRAVTLENQPALLALHNAPAAALSWQTPARFAALLQQACWSRTSVGDALLVALDQDAAYDNPDFAWLAQRFARFVYIDRIVVAAHARDRGLAGALHAEFKAQSRTCGQGPLVCEINLDPPNFASVALHERYGFGQVGRADLPGGKRVGDFACPL